MIENDGKEEDIHKNLKNNEKRIFLKNNKHFLKLV